MHEWLVNIHLLFIILGNSDSKSHGYRRRNWRKCSSGQTTKNYNEEKEQQNGRGPEGKQRLV